MEALFISHCDGGRMIELGGRQRRERVDYVGERDGKDDNGERGFSISVKVVKTIVSRAGLIYG